MNTLTCSNTFKENLKLHLNDDKWTYFEMGSIRVKPNSTWLEDTFFRTVLLCVTLDRLVLLASNIANILLTDFLTRKQHPGFMNHVHLGAQFALYNQVLWLKVFLFLKLPFWIGPFACADFHLHSKECMLGKTGVVRVNVYLSPCLSSHDSWDIIFPHHLRVHTDITPAWPLFTFRLDLYNILHRCFVH